MNVYKLIEKHKQNFPHSHFFDRETLKFFGERISEMRVLKDTVIVKGYDNEEHECYVLSSLQRKYPFGKRRAYHYFDVKNFEQITIREICEG